MEMKKSFEKTFVLRMIERKFLRNYITSVKIALKGVQKIIVGTFARGSYYNGLCGVPFQNIFCTLLLMNLCCEVKIISIMLYLCADYKHDS